MSERRTDPPRPVVLHVIPGLGAGGGAERSLAATAPFVVGELGGLHVAVLSDRQALVPELEACGVVVHDLSGATTAVERWRTIRRLVRTVRPDIVHASLYAADVPVQLAVWRRRPVIVTWAGTPYAPALRDRPGVTWWKVQVVRALEAALGRGAGVWYQAVTEGVARTNGRALRARADRVVVAGRGRPVAPPRDEARRVATRRALGLDDDAVMVLAVARHEPEKGVSELVDAFAELRRSVPGARLVVAGRPGNLTPSIVERIGHAGLTDAVDLLGARDDLDDLREAADLFVSSSVTEGAAGATLEAMAAGLPIVATAVDGMVGVLTDGVDAVLVPVGDPHRLAAAMGELIAAPERRRELGDAARETFSRRFTVERSAEELLSLYRRVASPRRAT